MARAPSVRRWRGCCKVHASPLPRSRGRVRCMQLSSFYTEEGWSEGAWVVLPAHQLAEPYPGLAIEADELYLLNGVKIRRARIDPDAGQKHRQLQVFQIGCLAHYVLARKVIAALLEYLHQRRRDSVSIDVVNVLWAAVRVVLLHECEVVLRSLLVLPGRVIRV